ncbi:MULTISPECIES: FAD-linked oxidase C-terminal domain-containing protein [unclassified Ensifer]|uniref:FAD-linked oxidase C-terminal domain-containing protein n=1 Tax=Ensifer canadensis TaxID=555315 RepID=UPI0012E3D258
MRRRIDRQVFRCLTYHGSISAEHGIGRLKKQTMRDVYRSGPAGIGCGIENGCRSARRDESGLPWISSGIHRQQFFEAKRHVTGFWTDQAQ